MESVGNGSWRGSRAWPAAGFWRQFKEYLRPYYLKNLYFALRPERCPEQFRSCWNYPAVELDGPAAPLPPPASGRADLLFLPMTDWHVRIQRTQHLAKTFASRGHRCLYLNPNLGREFPSVSGRGPVLRASLLAPRIVELHIQLPTEPVFHHRRLTRPENRMVVDGLRRAVDSIGPEALVQVVSSPLWLEAALRLREDYGAPIVYDCHDLLEGFGRFGEDIVDAEGALFRAADLVAFSSHWLMDRAAPEVRSKALLVRNAADAESFRGCMGRAEARETRIIGYAGALEFWFDEEAVRRAALRHPEWRFLLAGRIETPRIAPLRALPNVEFLGEVPYAHLPGFLERLDVGLIPFRRLPLTLAADPIKLYEYFAAGLPVAAARLPELERHGDLLYLADGPEGFVRAIERAAAESSVALRNRRMALAKQETWVSRCAALGERIAVLLEHRKPATQRAPGLGAPVAAELWG